MDTPLPQLPQAHRCPAWYSGPSAEYNVLYALCSQIRQGEARLSRRLRLLFAIGLALILVPIGLDQVAFAAGDGADHSIGVLFIALLPAFCGLAIALVHALELRCIELAYDSRYMVRLQASLRHIRQGGEAPAEDADEDAIDRLVHADADRLTHRLSANQAPTPSLIGHLR